VLVGWLSASVVCLLFESCCPQANWLVSNLFCLTGRETGEDHRGYGDHFGVDAAEVSQSNRWGIAKMGYHSSG